MRSKSLTTVCFCFFFAAVLPGLGLAQEASTTTLEALLSLMQDGQYEQAERSARELLARVESEQGPDSAETAEVLDVLLESRWRGGKATEPETQQIGERALEIKRSALGPDDAGVGKTLHHLAIVAYFGGDYVRARSLWQQAIRIREGALGSDHADVAESVNGLANVLTTLGDYETARELYARAVSIREAVYGAEHPKVGQTLNNLAGLLMVIGDYAEARVLCERSLAIKEAAVGPEHPQVAFSLLTLADILDRTGDRDEARQLLERAVKIWEKTYNPEHPRVGAALNNLAEQLRRNGQYDEARPLYDRVLAIWEANYGPDHDRVAIVLNNYAELLRATGDLERARQLQERGVRIREETLGLDHPDLAVSVNNLAELLMQMGDPAAAGLFERARSIREQAFGEDHPLVAESLYGLARFGLATGDDTAALASAIEAERIGRDHLRLTGRSLAEEQALLYAAVRPRSLDVALSIAVGSGGQGAIPEAFDALIRSRAVVLDEMAARRRSVARSANPEIARLAEELSAARARLANLTVRGLGSLDVETYRGFLDGARKDREAAERSLGQASAAFAREQQMSRLGLEAVAASLPERSALIAFVVYEHRSLASVPEPREDSTAAVPTVEKVRSYAALVLRSDASRPTAQRLGPAEEMDALVDRWKREAARGTQNIRRTAEQAELEYRKVGGELEARIWAPLATHLKGTDRVFVVPDGSLNLVSFGALPHGDEGYLLETGPLLHYVSAERDLVPAAGKRLARSSGLLALGGPDYDETSLFASLGGTAAEPTTAAPSALDARPPQHRGAACESFDTLRFAPLPAAAREAADIVALWDETMHKANAAEPNSEYLSASEASEAAFKRGAVGRRVLHLATHGFFLGGDCAGGGQSSRGFKVVEEPTTTLPDLGLSPLLLSGLALAGANHRGAAGANEEDGILTAEEIAGLDLQGVEWAVLSACDTGVGEIRAGEGVFGLRRAMQVAGVRTLIMSLWPVDDEATRRWMSALYRGRLQEKLDSSEAAREAGLAVLEQQRAAGESTHPFYWAAFVAAGDWH